MILARFSKGYKLLLKKLIVILRISSLMRYYAVFIFLFTRINASEKKPIDLLQIYQC
jgi:hypothetical protein